MELKNKTVLITGGYGFIGSHVVESFVKTYPETTILNLDRLDYVASRKNISAEVQNAPNYHEIIGDCSCIDLIRFTLKTFKVTHIIHFAAQTHVDNSFGNSFRFTLDNIYATHVLLECSRHYGKIEKFIHVSTDEVYGEIGLTDEPCDPEKSHMNPTNPYAASKISAEYIVKSYLISHKLPIIITRCNNVYGPQQYPEKVIPRFILQRHTGNKFTIQGTGASQRTFIYVSDVVAAYHSIICSGSIGKIYQIGTSDEFSMISLAKFIYERVPGSIPHFSESIEFVADRNFNDARYSIHIHELKKIGWNQQITFDDGMCKTIKWYTEKMGENHWDAGFNLGGKYLENNIYILQNGR